MNQPLNCIEANTTRLVVVIVVAVVIVVEILTAAAIAEVIEVQENIDILL